MRCDYCGTGLVRDATHCPSCGAPYYRGERRLPNMRETAYHIQSFAVEGLTAGFLTLNDARALLSMRDVMIEFDRELTNGGH